MPTVKIMLIVAVSLLLFAAGYLVGVVRSQPVGRWSIVTRVNEYDPIFLLDTQTGMSLFLVEDKWRSIPLPPSTAVRDTTK